MTWNVNILTLFPEMFLGPLGQSLSGKATKGSMIVSFLIFAILLSPITAIAETYEIEVKENKAFSTSSYITTCKKEYGLCHLALPMRSQKNNIFYINIVLHIDNKNILRAYFLNKGKKLLTSPLGKDYALFSLEKNIVQNVPLYWPHPLSKNDTIDSLRHSLVQRESGSLLTEVHISIKNIDSLK